MVDYTVHEKIYLGKVINYEKYYLQFVKLKLIKIILFPIFFIFKIIVFKPFAFLLFYMAQLIKFIYFILQIYNKGRIINEYRMHKRVYLMHSIF